MFGEVRVPRSCRAVVNGKLEDKTRFYVGKNVPLYFVDFTPAFRDVSVAARCKEGIEHHLVVTVRYALPADLGRILAEQGHSDRSRIQTVKIEELLNSKPLVDAVKAAAARYIREAAFGDLGKPDKVFADLEKAIHNACSDANIIAQLVSSEVTRKMPSDEELAQVGAAGYTDVAKYFRDAKEQIPKLKADVEIAKLNEDERKHEREAELAESARRRDEQAKRRNSEVLELAAQLQFKYDLARKEEKKTLVLKENELADLKKTEDETARERRKLDTQADLECEELRAKIRRDDKSVIIAEATKLLTSVAGLPRPDYSQVHTLVNPRADGLHDIVHGLLGVLLNGVLDVPSGDDKSTGASA
jgi:hypothetical protein